MKSKSTIGVILILVAILVIVGTFWLTGNNNKSNQSNEINNPPSSIQPSNTPSSNEVTIEGFAFSLIELKIKKGSTVTWTNKDTARHTVTSDSGSELSSGLFGKDETYTHVFNQAGVYDYHCIPHPYMKGTIIVE